MNIKKLFAAGLLCIAVTAFSGCQAGQNTDVYSTPADGSQQVDTKPAPSLADQTAYEGALRLNDVTYCDKIEVETVKSQCKIDLSDAATLKSATEKNDASLCKNISTEDKQKACQVSIEISQQELSEKNQREEATKSEYDLLNKTVAAGDYTQCAAFKDQNFISACEENILTNKALSSKDASWCEKIDNKEAKERCSSALKITN